MAPPELAKLRKPSKMLLNIGFSRPAQAPYGVHALSLKKKDRSPQKCIDRRTQSKLTIPRKYPLPALTRLFDHPCEMKYFSESDILSKYYRVRTTKAKGLETTCVTGHRAYEFPVVKFSLGVVDVTKTPKLEAEQFSCVAQTDSLIKRSPFEIKGNRHSLLPPLADDAYVGDRPQVHRVEVE
ncbi:RNA-directed DNA polymerase-like protein [Cucumis melo var. makuwa]|uniref:RNA-directed DNA polymerase-like protein n=1 Tax=Cucumis melo var. makuwa TaxID=1194695 RepID=A0A5A7V5M5_CUCMM|nr:RNA-directed DNA polymerase-like protein [Cucumis melo var. makuwa]